MTSRLLLPLTTATTSLSSSSSSDFPCKSLKTLHTASPNFNLYSPSSPSSSSFPHSQHRCTRKHRGSLPSPMVYKYPSLYVCVCVGEFKSWVLIIEMFWMKKLVNFYEFGHFIILSFCFGIHSL